jgi:hypothetical protein
VQRGEHQVARERRLHRDFRRIAVADFADHDDVGILPQYVFQHPREAEARRLVDLVLVDDVELIFDRVFDRDDVLLDALQEIDAGVERRGLAAAGRPGDEDQPVAAAQQLLQQLEIGGLHADFLDVEDGLVLVEHPQHDFLAIDSRERAEPQIDSAALREDLHPAILRHAPLRDVERSHHLQARHDGGVQVPAHLEDLVEYAVDAETHDPARARALDVYVARAVAHGALYEPVHEIDDGTGARHLVDDREVALRLLHQLDIGRQVFDQVLRYSPAAERVELALGDVFSPREHQGQLAAGDALDFVEDRNRMRVRDRERERIVDLEHRHYIQPARGAVREERDRLGLVHPGPERNIGDARLLRQGPEEIRVGQQLLFEQDRAELLAAPRLQFHRFVQLLLRDQRHLDQDAANPYRVRRGRALADRVHHVRPEIG